MPDRVITRSQDLDDFCRQCKDTPYITVDTEFLREKTYYPKLCLIQLGKPKTDSSPALAIAVDPLSDDINLNCLEDLFFDPNVVKVFHAARQDLEIMMQLFDGRVPAPIFDTQIAAMVTGHGDQVGYQSLVKQICNIELDKTNQYTNWSKRPLSKDQIDYAIADVTHLREIYEALVKQLDQSGRTFWVQEELNNLCDPDTIQQDPHTAWTRIKVRSDKPKVLNVLKELAAWREKEAMAQDKPKHFIIRDEVIAELAKQSPKNDKALDNIRGLPEKFRKGERAKDLIATIRSALESDKSTWPKPMKRPHFPQELVPALEMLKMLLKIKAAEHSMVSRIIAHSDDLEDFLAAPDKAKIMQGWRKDIFGQYAEKMLNGDLALKLSNKKIILQNI